RVRHQSESALKIARFLEQHRKTARVNYPGLESHPNHLRACELFDGFGAVLSFELEGAAAAAEKFIARATIPISAPSLGGVETLITRPAATSHSGMSPEHRARAGISDGLIRLSVGLEASDDLIEDISDAMRAI
ncbi:MAG TPA: PLP-dependent transferase, partial [Candidatus Binataceae bacterium]|nr:PLP-dependent transferase [Candidatus Binataceae bacterium]